MLKRVLWIVPGFPAFEGDPAYVFLEREARLLAGTGDVELVVACENPTIVDGPWESAMLRSTSGPVSKLRMVFWMLRSARIVAPFLSFDRSEWLPVVRRLWALDLVLRAHQPDIVHSHFAEPQGTGGAAVSRRRGAVSVCSLRGVDLAVDEELGYGYRLDRKYELRLQATLKSVACCLVATTEMSRLAIELGADPSRVRVRPNPLGFETAERGSGESMALPADDWEGILAVCVGRLERSKNFRVAIAAAALDQSFRVLLLGDGSDRAELESLAKELGVSERVTFSGAVSTAVVRATLDRADVFWSPSLRESFGNAVLEAAQVGISLVCFPTGVANDLIPVLDRADFFDGSAPDLVTKTHKVISEDVLPRERLLSPYDRAAWASGLVDLYSDLCGAR